MTARGLRKEMIGTVISDKMQKTVVVETKRHVAHPRYRKVLLRLAKFVAHDEKEAAGEGDLVRIRESRPLSKTKRWTVVEVLHKAAVTGLAAPVAQADTPPKKTRRKVERT